MHYAILTDQSTLRSADLDSLASLLVPSKVLLVVLVGILVWSSIALGPETANGSKVLLVELVAALEDAKTAVFGAVGGEVGDTLVELEGGAAGVLVNV